ncbi:HlyD family secretion protein [Segatella baroniae F0067]|uniref:HlyD family secretion protein n=1 Tax=Segatella baroniae F0067 TaxID=1115809 RepID=U2P3N9_9BACT|nr:HlyD family efflux transporter periplasmic adaptor subunit [Segatella baroniae]ERK38801.1 HlyD family secretion protein [Segatella baroniae F0067]
MKYHFLLVACLLLAGCATDDKEFDATGTFEATEVTVSAEQTGRLLRFTAEEGCKVEAGSLLGLVDTVQLYLRARQIGATRLVYATQRPDIHKQIAATRQQIAKARQDVERFTQLVGDGAANRKQLDDATHQLAFLRRQLEAQTATLQNSANSLSAQMNTADVEKLQVADQLAKCRIHTPIGGTILETYVEPGEFVTTGKPLFTVADIDRMYLRAYLTSNQLRNVKLGQRVNVLSDYGDGRRKSYPGTVTWISSKSEFTPKTILTDDERANLVYAVKIAVRNDGHLKIGMYGEVKL